MGDLGILEGRHLLEHGLGLSHRLSRMKLAQYSLDPTGAPETLRSPDGASLPGEGKGGVWVLHSYAHWTGRGDTTTTRADNVTMRTARRGARVWREWARVHPVPMFTPVK